MWLHRACHDLTEHIYCDLENVVSSQSMWWLHRARCRSVNVIRPYCVTGKYIRISLNISRHVCKMIYPLSVDCVIELFASHLCLKHDHLDHSFQNGVVWAAIQSSCWSKRVWIVYWKIDNHITSTYDRWIVTSEHLHIALSFPRCSPPAALTMTTPSHCCWCSLQSKLWRNYRGSGLAVQAATPKSLWVPSSQLMLHMCL